MMKFTNTMPHAEYPLGGIGTGTITLNASGELTDFQIFNRPSLGMKVPYTFFSIYTKGKDGSDARALEATANPNYYKGRGWHPSHTQGLPRFSASEMEVRVPFANIDFAQDNLPVKVSMTAWNPFIPGNEDDSEFPGALFDIVLKNTTDASVEAMVALSMGNIHNFRGADSFDNPLQSNACRNEAKREDGLTGVFMTGDELPEDALLYGNNALMTDDPDAIVCARWHLGAWYDGFMDFWDHFEKGELTNQDNSDFSDFSRVGPTAAYVGSIAIRKTLQPGEEKHLHFCMTWYTPNRTRGWGIDKNLPTIKNHYATRFPDAWSVGLEMLKRRDVLEADSRRFTDAIYSTTVSDSVLDAAVSNISVLRSTTCWRMPDGTLMGWEGSHEQEGSCCGTCMHVWNYAQTIAYLFPKLEQSVRENEFLVEIEDNGKLPFRCFRKLGLPESKFYPAVDGTYGTIMRAWREWKLGGDKAYLDKIYPKLLTAFDYGMKIWDLDGDGVPDGKQHNTYDIEFYGPNPLSTVMELGAIRAVEEFAKVKNDPQTENAMKALFEKVQKNFEALCWQGEFYIQNIDDVDKYPYQFGEGCLSDQLLGQTLAFLTGLGDLLPREHLLSAAKAIFKYNFAKPEGRRPCLQRKFIADDETGLLLASWPKGNKPRFPFVYSDEVWNGIEYQVATTLIYLGLDKEALEMVDAIRSRFDGIRRSPWAEMECGFYYSRSMASWGMLVALSGFECDVAKGEMTFAPHGEGKYFWSNGDGWGLFNNSADGCSLQVLYGQITLNALKIPNVEGIRSVSINSDAVDFKVVDGSIALNKVPLKNGDTLTIA